MWRRSRYYIDAFFSTVASVGDPVQRTTTGIARFSEAQARELLRTRLRHATSAADSELTSLAALPQLKAAGAGPGSQRVGFVGVALTDEIGERFIREVHIPDSGSEQDDETADKKKALLDLFKTMMARNPSE
jgi:hypothetical protein